MPSAPTRTTSMLDLPSELILLVFKAEPSILDVLRLTSTCKRLRSLWLANWLNISDCILPREISCYPDALMLARAQATLTPSHYQESLDKVAHLRAEHFPFHSDCEVAADCAKTSLKHVDFPGAHQPEMEFSPQERKDRERVIAMYENLIELAGDGGCGDEYYRHLRHLRRIFYNAQEAGIVARLYIRAHLGYAYRAKFTNCSLHPVDRALDHELERAIQSVYYTRLCLLGTFNDRIREQYLAQVSNLPSERLYVLGIFLDKFLPDAMLWGDMDETTEANRALGLIYPLGSNGHSAMYCQTPEWHAAIRNGAHTEVSSLCHHRMPDYRHIMSKKLYGPLDRCPGIERPCIADQGGKAA